VPKTLESDALAAIAELRDPLGVLSIYVDADPERQSTDRPPWAVAVKDGLRDLLHRTKEEGPRERWAALKERVDDMEAEIAETLATATSGRGRVLFAGIESGATRRMTLQMPLETRVVLEDGPYLRPLVAALDAGRSTGIVNVSRSGVEVHEWRLGAAREVEEAEFQDRSDRDREKKGPAAAIPARGQQTAPQHDRHEQTIDDRRHRFLASMADRVGALAAERRWSLVLVTGDPRVGPSLLDRLSLEDGVEVVPVWRAFEGRPAHEVADALMDEIRAAAARRRGRLVERVEGESGATVGLAPTLFALHERRVAELLYDEGRDHRGARLPDGRLVPEPEAGAAGAEGATSEPRLVERMIEAALAGGADVVPLTGDEAARVSPHDGVAALLRW